MLKQWGRIWAIGFVLWTVLAFLSAAGAHVYTASMGSPENWAQLLPALHPQTPLLTEQ